MRSKPRILLAAGLAVWALAVVAAFGALARYSSTPGSEHQPGAGAAEFLAAHRHSGRPLVAMVVHPRCPCTDASLAELGDFLARTHAGCDAVLVRFVGPGWPAGEPVVRLGGVPVPVVSDPGGRIASVLGADTSGHCVLMDANGKIRFYGGLTIARGHRGESPVQAALLAVVGGDSRAVRPAPVYGCSITGSGTCPAPSSL